MSAVVSNDNKQLANGRSKEKHIQMTHSIKKKKNSNLFMFAILSIHSFAFVMHILLVRCVYFCSGSKP